MSDSRVTFRDLMRLRETAQNAIEADMIWEKAKDEKTNNDTPYGDHLDAESQKLLDFYTVATPKVVLQIATDLINARNLLHVIEEEPT